MIMIKKANIFTFVVLFFLGSCSLSPGMHMSTKSMGQDSDFVYLESIDKKIVIENISDNKELQNPILEKNYRIGKGDQIAITIWGMPEIFPVVNINQDLNLRRVDSNGDIFFPYAGVVNAENKTQDELRKLLYKKLSVFFNEPQVDVSIARFNSQKIYMLGEVMNPMKLNITDINLSLSDALGEVRGINPNTGDGSNVFIIRNRAGQDPRIFRANLDSPKGFVDANNFYLEDNDIVFVNSKGTTRWNRVISQFFPFSSFLNSIDRLIEN